MLDPMNDLPTNAAADEIFVLEFDGASRGNPGPAGAGFAIRARDGTVLCTGGEYHPSATNNFAEYRALIAGLTKAVELKIQKLDVRGDSQLVIRQMSGQYKVRHPNIIPLHKIASDLARKFSHISYHHLYRESNTLADKLSNIAINKKGNQEALSDVLE